MRYLYDEAYMAKHLKYEKNVYVYKIYPKRYAI